MSCSLLSILTPGLRLALMLPLGEGKDAPGLGSLEMGHKCGPFLLVLPGTRIGQAGYHVSLIPHVASSV